MRALAEQYGPKTLLAIFCGPKGNGKTMRTERLAEAFVPGWVVMSGPASVSIALEPPNSTTALSGNAKWKDWHLCVSFCNRPRRA